MGFTIYYRTTKPVDAQLGVSIRQAVNVLCVGRTWLSCEPVAFFSTSPDGHLLGRSKPNLDPHPDDIASAMLEGLPDGTVNHVIEILCSISREYDVDWEFSHDHDPGPVGFIRNGVCDSSVRDLALGFDDLGEILSQELGLADSDVDDDDDEPPRILKFPGR